MLGRKTLKYSFYMWIQSIFRSGFFFFFQRKHIIIVFATSSSWKLLFLFSPSPYHFLSWWQTKLLLSSPCMMPVTLNRTQCHSNNSFVFAPWAVEVLDLNLNGKRITQTLSLTSWLSCMAHYFCEEIYHREWDWCLQCECLPWPCSI